MRSGFYNSEIIGYDDEQMPIFDRAQDAEFFASFFKSFFTNGVFPTPANALQVISANGMTVQVNPGRAFVEGYFAIEEESRNLTIDSASSLDRIDRVVLRLDLQTREMDLYILKGTPNSIPVAPSLTRPVGGEGGDIYEIGLADIKVSKNSVSISQSQITDLRLNSELCGVVTQTVQNLNSSVYYEQLQAMLAESKVEFEVWFEQIKDILDENTAGTLLQMILELQAELTDVYRKDEVYTKGEVYNKTEVNSQFAPNGFGLGTTAKLITDWNNARESGFYQGYNTTLNSPVTGYYVGFVSLYGSTYIYQQILEVNTGRIYTRNCINNVWKPWVQMSRGIFKGASFVTPSYWGDGDLFIVYS